METGKPLISILMALYEPRLDWLKEQLDSLEAQTFPNLKLYVCDDCSSTVPFEAIQGCVSKAIRSFPYEIRRNEKNLGSNLTFQALTEEADGEYLAYCDQDDIWIPEKLEILQAEMERTGALLACSDMYIIDSDGKRVAKSMTEVRKHHVFRSGDNLAEGLLIHNFVSGCAMLVRSSIAKEACPFCPYMVYDHYLALYAANQGSIQSLEEQLISHRVHSANQTGLLTGVIDKASYGRERIDLMVDRLHWLRDHFLCGPDLKAVLDESVEWAEARQQNWAHHGGKATVWKYRHFSSIPSVFEIVANWMPEPIFQLAIQAGKRNLV